ncbi:unnamed protein product [Lactuca virosa]|uniref:RecA family profile 1 domain-containing protein n=1 Tax=Lactuca virosa TaxID=75947 RepID=A0AAU9N4G8_9ASTR|nr:unnamed protein product [Lactuca virosa]
MEVLKVLSASPSTYSTNPKSKLLNLPFVFLTPMFSSSPPLTSPLSSYLNLLPVSSELCLSMTNCTRLGGAMEKAGRRRRIGAKKNLIRSGSVDVVVVESVAALVPKCEVDGEMGDAHMAMRGRLMSQALRKLSHSLSTSQTILIFINQVLLVCF